MAQQNDGLNVPLSRVRTALIVSLLTLGSLLVLTTIGLVVAFLVDISRDFHVSVPMAGQLLTVSAIAWALSSILLGPLSDRTGRKVMVLGGLVVGGIGFFGYALAPSFLWIMGLSVVVGIGGAMAGPHFITCIGDYFSSEGRGRIMAMVTAGAPLSSLIGIPMGSYIANSLGWRASIQILGMIMILSGLLGFFVLPSAMPYRSRPGRAVLASFSEAMRERHLLHLVTANTLMEGAFHIVYSYLIAFLIIHFSLNLKQAAPLIAFMAIGQLIGNFVGGPLADRCDKLKICAVAQMMVGLAGLTMMTFAPALWFTVLFGALYKGAYSSTRPAFFSLMILSETSRGASMGLVATSNHLGRALGALVGGLILGFTGYHSLGLVCLALSIGATSVFLYLIRSARKS